MPSYASKAVFVSTFGSVAIFAMGLWQVVVETNVLDLDSNRWHSFCVSQPRCTNTLCHHQVGIQLTSEAEVFFIYSSSIATYLQKNMPRSSPPIREGIALACLDFRDPATYSVEHILSRFVDILDSNNPAFHAQLQRIITEVSKPYRSKVSAIKNLLQSVTCEPVCVVYDKVLLVVGGMEALTSSERRVLLNELRGLLGACAGAVRVLLVGGERGEDWEGGEECQSMDLEVSTKDIIENIDAHWRSELASGSITEHLYNQLIVSKEMYV